MAERLARQCDDGLVVQHIARFVDQSVLTMRGERIERNVSNHPKIGHGLLERTRSALGETLWIPGFYCIQAFRRQRSNRKQSDCRYTERMHASRLGDQKID